MERERERNMHNIVVSVREVEKNIKNMQDEEKEEKEWSNNKGK